jgi:hypothetical protein
MQIYGCFGNKISIIRNIGTHREETVISLKEVSKTMANKIPLHLRTRVVLVQLEMRFAYGSPYAVQVPEVVRRNVTLSQLKKQAQSNMLKLKTSEFNLG